jgi:hypothetical protein
MSLRLLAAVRETSAQCVSSLPPSWHENRKRLPLSSSKRVRVAQDSRASHLPLALAPPPRIRGLVIYAPGQAFAPKSKELA